MHLPFDDVLDVRKINVKLAELHSRHSPWRKLTPRYWCRQFRRLFRAISRTASFAVFGWNNTDYDYVFFLSTMLFKLRRMQEFNRLHGMGDCPERDKSLRVAIKLLERLCHGEYTVSYDKFVASFGHPYVDAYGKLAPAKKEELRDAIDRDYKMNKRDSDLFFAICAKYVTYWWD